MKEATDANVCSCCGEAITDEIGYCTSCFKKPESDDKLDRVLAEITLGTQVFPVEVRWVRIGRDPSNQIVLNDDRHASRYHAWVTYEGEDFFLEDLGSTNGTRLNGQIVEKRELLHSGDKISIGETEMIFRLQESA